MKARLILFRTAAVMAVAASLPTPRTHAALLAYEPFTNASGAAIVGAGGGYGFSGNWQANSSSGVATNTGYGLGYKDSANNVLVTAGGAGFFQGSTTANSAMQPVRLLNFSRGTNGTDGGTTWISFLVLRQGPTGTLGGNPFGKGGNMAHDIDAGAIQKLAIGNSSGATSNTVGLIPQGNSGNLKGATNVFGGVTNFVVVRIDHVIAAANDNAYLFVNPVLNVEPSTNAPGAVSLNTFDFSFDRVRAFAGGQNGTAQPFVQIILDEYRIGQTYADVAPMVTNVPPPVLSGSLLITHTTLVPGGIVLSGQGGSNGGTYFVLTATNLITPLTNWAAIATNAFGPNGDFLATNPVVPGVVQQFFRLLVGTPPTPPVLAPVIMTQPTNQSVAVSNNATFVVAATGAATLKYQWYFNTNTPLVSATNASLTLPNVQPDNAGAYTVIVTNNYGAVTSVVATLVIGSPLVPGAYFVSVNTGNDSNPGTLASPFLTISKGLSKIAGGGVVYLRSGTYALTATLSLSGTSASSTNRIRLWAYPGETPVIDGSGIADRSKDGISIGGDYYHLKGLEEKLAGHNGIKIAGDSNIVENCVTHDNGNTGLHLTGGQTGASISPAYNLILNCDSYLNFDVPATGDTGGNADGFSAKWDLGPGNVFRGCRAWLNSDDGWDFWMGNSPLVIDGCWAFYNGTNYWNDARFKGNGNGFKLGGNYVGTPHRTLRSVAFRNMKHGFDQNNNVAGQTIDNNTGWANGAKNFYLDHNSNNAPVSGDHIVRNNVSIGGANGDTFWPGTVFTSNSWDVVLAPAANNSDLQSVDYSAVMALRQADGSLPFLPFLRPVSGGRLIDKGVDVGEPYAGAAPDLGAFEDGL